MLRTSANGTLIAPGSLSYWYSEGYLTSSQSAPRRTLSEACGEGEATQQRLAQQLVEVRAVQAHDLAVGERGDGGVALRFRHQRFLAEGVAALQFGEHDLGAADHAPDLEAAGVDHVVVVAFVALADQVSPRLAA